MKILHIHPSLEGGGIEAMICSLANVMAQTHDVSVCSIFEPKESDVFYQRLSPAVHRETCHKRKQGFSLKELFLIYRLIRKGKYDIVHLHGFLYYYLLSILLMVGSKTRFVYTVHNDAVRENGHWDRKIWLVKRLLFAHRIVHPVTISDVSKASFTELYRCDSKLIFNGIPRPVIRSDYHSPVLEAYRLTPNTSLLLNAARIDTQKNQLVLCQVAQQLIEEGEDIVLLMAGNVTNELMYQSIKPFLSDRIVYLGERQDIPQLLSEVDAFCLPSLWEGLPVTLLESLGVGCIPICSPVGGVVNVIQDGYDGLLSASSRIEDYQEVLKRFLSMSAEERNRLRRAGQMTFGRFEISKTSQEYVSYYQELLA